MRFSVWPDPGRPTDEVLDLARFADDLGWYGFWFADHYMPNTGSEEIKPGDVHEVWSVLPAVAAVTEKVRIGPLVSPTSVHHPAILANRAILANGALVGGHAIIGDGAFLSGNAVVHQFCRVGSMAMMQGCSGVSLDLPPFTIVRGINGMCGLNSVGLKRAGFSSEERLELKQAYRALFMGSDLMKDAIAKARERFAGVLAEQFIDFIDSSERGTCSHTKR